MERQRAQGAQGAGGVRNCSRRGASPICNTFPAGAANPCPETRHFCPTSGVAPEAFVRLAARGACSRNFSRFRTAARACGEELHHHQADDFPAYLVIVDRRSYRGAAGPLRGDAFRACLLGPCRDLGPVDGSCLRSACCSRSRVRSSRSQWRMGDLHGIPALPQGAHARGVASSRVARTRSARGRFADLAKPVARVASLTRATGHLTSSNTSVN